MRAANLIGITLLGIVVLVMAPAMSVGQGKKGGSGGFPGGGGGGFPGGGGGIQFGGGGLPQDPNALFDMLAKGRQFFLISETRTLNRPLTQFAQEKGISSGQITRQQFIEFQDWRAKQQAAGGGEFNKGPGGFPGGGGPGKKNFGGDGPRPEMMNQGNPPSPDMINQLAETEFKRADSNGDGRLNTEEMPKALRFNLAKYDTNGDNLIDLNEFKLYFAARMQGNDDSSNRGVASIIIQDEDLDAKPVVFRAGGKMPANLPPWFKELDTDQDGQVALYEWRRAGKAMDEFLNWDQNSDGFITPDEAQKQQAALAKNSKNSMASMAYGGGEDGENKWGKKKGPGGFPGWGNKGEGGGSPWGNKTGADGSSERPAFGFPFGQRPGSGDPGATDSGERTKKGNKNGGKKGGGN